jgi:hypothetical protein
MNATLRGALSSNSETTRSRLLPLTTKLKGIEIREVSGAESFLRDGPKSQRLVKIFIEPVQDVGRDRVAFSLAGTAKARPDEAAAVDDFVPHVFEVAGKNSDAHCIGGVGRAVVEGEG